MVLVNLLTTSYSQAYTHFHTQVMLLVNLLTTLYSQAYTHFHTQVMVLVNLLTTSYSQAYTHLHTQVMLLVNLLTTLYSQAYTHLHTQVMVLVNLLKVIRAQEPTDKVVLVSNYTEALDILGKVQKKNKPTDKHTNKVVLFSVVQRHWIFGHGTKKNKPPTNSLSDNTKRHWIFSGHGTEQKRAHIDATADYGIGSNSWIHRSLPAIKRK